MSYKLALHVLVAFTEEVVPIHKHITYSQFPRYQEQKQWHYRKGSGEVNWPQSLYIFILSTSLVSCNLKNGFRRFFPHIIYVTSNFPILNLTKRKCSPPFTSILRTHSFMHYRSRGGQIANREPHVIRHRIYSGPRKHSGDSSNLKYPPTRHSKR